MAMLLAVLTRWDAPAEERQPEPRPNQARNQAPAGPAAPRPEFVRRADWGADEQLVREHSAYADGRARAVFLHHTNHPNGYDCADVPGMMRTLQATHIRNMGWDDMGYNFVVDRCGTIYEGRGGGADRPVKGAHTKGFNARSVGIAALGNFGAGQPVPRAMLRSIAAVAAWKLRPGTDPHGKVRLVSTNGGSRYPKGEDVRLEVVSGHRDGFETSCPGDALYARLPQLRDEVAALRTDAAAEQQRTAKDGQRADGRAGGGQTRGEPPR
ncbi:peptidoglycan recognition protein family protein [Streptomyces gossypii]